MGLFSKEQPYSREAYNEAEKDHKSKEKSRAEIGGGYYSGGEYRKHSQSVHDALGWAENRAREKLKRLYDQGHAEANTLNAEYDRLTAQARQAFEALNAFEKDKLGMSEKGDKEVSDESGAGREARKQSDAARAQAIREELRDGSEGGK